MAIVESVVSFLVERLGDQLIREISLLRDERNQIEWVRREFKRMECFLKDMDIGRAEESERVKNWRLEVRDAAHRAEDVIDIFFLEIAPLRRYGFLGTIRRYAFICSELMARRELLSEVEMIKADLESIIASRSRYGFEYLSGGGGGSSSSQQSQSLRERRIAVAAPHVEEPDFTGFDGDVKALIQRLTQGEQRRCVVGVVGMGGLGKTTLARNIYKNVAVQKHFHPCIWLSISQVYSAKELLQAVIRSCMSLSEEEQKKVGRMNTSELSEMIAKYLAGKTYVVVLDDMWTPDAWDELKHAFPHGNNGSRVLLTTRNKDVALHADAQSKPHDLRFLTEAESWELFCKKAFPGRDASFPLPDMEKQSREMVKKCGGLPLAVVVIGGLLSRKEPREWENVRNSINWQFVEGQFQISDILSLSYKELPYDLKPCFLYLGIFPEDYEFPAKKLVKLWAAEGFLHQRGNEMVEKVGEDCLRELIQRSLVQVARTSAVGGVKSCRIHDLLRDLCISEAKEERFLEIDGGHINNRVAPSLLSRGTTRRLAIHHGRKYYCLHHVDGNLHSLVIHGQDGQFLGKRHEKLIGGNFSLLRVLDLIKVRIEKLPSEIGEVIHLRYFSCLLITMRRSIRRSIVQLERVYAEASLPSSIGNLTNLQTLLVYSDDNVKIPGTIEKLKQLRHLEIKILKVNLEMYPQRSGGMIKGKPRLHYMSRELSSLANVWAGKWLHKDCLREMMNLRKLGICLYSKSKSKKGECVGEGEWESIVGLEFLESLLVSSVHPRNREKNLQLKIVSLNHLRRLSKLCLVGKLEKAPESSLLPLNLTKLTLRLSCLEQDPLPVLEKLENLQVLKLENSSFLGKEMVCSAGGFSRLKSLSLQDLYNLEEWRVEQGSMPLLLFLRIEGCFRLKMVPEGLQHMTSLKTLQLRGMGWEFYERVKRESGEDWHKVFHIPSVDVPV